MQTEDRILLNNLLDAVESGTGVLKVDIISKSRKREVSDARKIFYHVACHKIGRALTLTELGVFLNRDHSTVLHNRTQAETLLQIDKKFNEQYNRVIHHCGEIIKSKFQQQLNYNSIPQY